MKHTHRRNGNTTTVLDLFIENIRATKPIIHGISYKKVFMGTILTKPKQAIDFVSLILSQKYINEYGICIIYHVEAKIIQFNCSLVDAIKCKPYKNHLIA